MSKRCLRTVLLPRWAGTGGGVGREVTGAVAGRGGGDREVTGAAGVGGGDWAAPRGYLAITILTRLPQA